MDELKSKKEYAYVQIKLYNHINALDDLLKKYINNSNSVSYKQISNLNKTISKLLVHSEKLKQNLIYFELVG